LSTLRADADELRETVAWLRMEVGELTERVEQIEPSEGGEE
jgi:hypothetical protein